VNFYVSTPLKNKFLQKTEKPTNSLKVLDDQLIKTTGVIFNKAVQDFNPKPLIKDLKKIVNDGEIKNNLLSPISYDYTPSINLDFDSLVNNYKKGNVFFKKNEKQVIKALENLGSESNL